MRDKRNKKRGSLTVEQCLAKARELIAVNGSCLFLIDGKGFSKRQDSDQTNPFDALISFTRSVTEELAEELPVNELAVTNRVEKGFQYFLGDASWAGIADPETIVRIVAFKERHYPELELYYGVAADAWSAGIELVK
jgi:hypothetical protein